MRLTGSCRLTKVLLKRLMKRVLKEDPPISRRQVLPGLRRLMLYPRKTSLKDIIKPDPKKLRKDDIPLNIASKKPTLRAARSFSSGCILDNLNEHLMGGKSVRDEGPQNNVESIDHS
ncbi:hypothetical protein Hanom_Chr05g00461331 [Helianthus anomalus]